METEVLGLVPGIDLRAADVLTPALSSHLIALDVSVSPPDRNPHVHRDGAGNEPPSRPAESSVKNRAMLRTWAIPRVTGGDPGSRLWRKVKQRESGSTSSMAKRARMGGGRGRMGANPPSSPTRSVLSPRLPGRTYVG